MKKCETYELLYFFIAAMINDQRCNKNYLVYSSSFATFQSFHVALHLLLVWSSSSIKILEQFSYCSTYAYLHYLATIYKHNMAMGVEEEMVVCTFKFLVIKNFHEILIKYWHEWNLPSINVEFQYIKKFKPPLIK